MDDKLSDVLGHISRPQLADHPLTRAFLDAGVRLLEEELSAKHTDEGRPKTRSLLRVTRSRVISEVLRGAKHLRKGGPGSLRDRWRYFSDYLGDLIRYALRSHRWGVRRELARQAVDAIGTDRLSAVVHEVAYRDLKLMTSDPGVRFKTLITAFADRDPVVAEALSRSYRDATEAWRAVYAAFFRTRGLRLRPGVSLEDITIILTATAEGLTLRALGDRTAPVLDHQRRRCLLGTAALALMIACVDQGNGDQGNGESLDAAADRMADPSSGAAPAR